MSQNITKHKARLHSLMSEESLTLQKLHLLRSSLLRHRVVSVDTYYLHLEKLKIANSSPKTLAPTYQTIQ